MWMLGMPAGLMAIAGAAALVGTVVAATVGMHVYREPSGRTGCDGPHSEAHNPDLDRQQNDPGNLR
jgi:hypothetical protein